MIKRVQESLPGFIVNRIVWTISVTRFLFRRFVEQRGLQTASSLAYTTLMSLVPLITVMFGFLGGLPVFKDMAGDIQSFIFENFVPSFGNALQGYLFEFADKASKLTITGIAMLLVIALMLMATIDNSLNRIWHVREKRSPVARFLVYWAILTLGPLLVGFGLWSTSYLLSLPALDGLYASFGIKATVLRLVPFITTSFAFTLLYIVVPNCFVYRKHALAGGVVAACLFEMAKFGFGIYLKAVPTYQAIYGAIAIIPIFLIWIYLSWVIVILGAHLTYCISNLDSLDMGYGDDWDFNDIYRVIFRLWQQQKQGGSLSVPQLKKSGLKISQNRIGEILRLLEQARWVNRGAAGNFWLTRDMSEATVAELHQVMPYKLFRSDSLSDDEMGKPLHDVQNQYQQMADSTLNISLKSLFEQSEAGKS